MGKMEIVLRDFRLDDIDNKIKWINDPQNNAYLHYDLPLEKGKTISWYNNKDNDTRKDCVIVCDDVPVGLVGLIGIDFKNKKAEYYISMGEVAYKRKGIGSIATKLILSYAFNTLHLNKVYLNVDDNNEAACKMYEANGFVCEGIFKEDLFHNGKLIDRRRYAIFNRDFKG